MKASAEVQLIFDEQTPESLNVTLTIEPHTPIEHDVLTAVAKRDKDVTLDNGKLVAKFDVAIPALRLVSVGGKGTLEEERSGYILESYARAADAEAAKQKEAAEKAEADAKAKAEADEDARRASQEKANAEAYAKAKLAAESASK